MNLELLRKELEKIGTRVGVITFEKDNTLNISFKMNDEDESQVDFLNIKKNLIDEFYPKRLQQVVSEGILKAVFSNGKDN